MFAFDYNDLCLSTVFKGGRPAVQSGLITTEVIGGRAGVADTGDGPEDRKKSPKRSQMTSCDLIQFSITVSSNHGERRERMKGRQRRRWIDEGIFLGGGGWSHNTTRTCVKCNKVGDWASGRLSAFSRRHKSHWCASPVRGLTCLYSCGLFYPARRLTTGVTNHTLGVSDFFYFPHCCRSIYRTNEMTDTERARVIIAAKAPFSWRRW